MIEFNIIIRRRIQPTAIEPLVPAAFLLSDPMIVHPQDDSHQPNQQVIHSAKDQKPFLPRSVSWLAMLCGCTITSSDAKEEAGVQGCAEV